MLAKHDPVPLISHRFPLMEAKMAFDLLDQRGETAVQPVLEFL